MGYIYKAEAPNGKIYIGQTISSVDKRWKEHIYDALDPKKDRCKLLNASIRKYGADQFKLSTIIECDNSSLNVKEIEFISKFQSLCPNGLNLKLGGLNNTHLESTKDKIRNKLIGCNVPISRRLKLSQTKKADNDLPMYVVKFMRNGVHEGYRVCNHPMGGEKRFTKDDNNINLQHAINHLKYLDSLSAPLIPVSSQLPKYISREKNNGFCVRYKQHRKSFSKSNTDNLELALNYIKTLLEMDTVQRLDGSGSLEENSSSEA